MPEPATDPIDPNPADPASPPNDPPADPGAGDPPTDPPVNYFQNAPDDWRDQLAGEDEKFRSHLDRVLDLNVFAGNYKSMQGKIRAGEISSGLPEDATPEQMADWRAANGVPEAANDYELTLADGVTMDEYDQKVFASANEAAHKHNVSVDALSDITNSIMKAQALEAEASIAEDNMQQQATTQALKASWGQDYQANTNMVQGLINQLPGEIKEQFEGARLSDGRGVLNSPEMMTFFAGLARELNPAGVVAPNSNNPGQTVATELAALKQEMEDDYEGWFKKLDKNARYDELLQYQVDMEERGGR